MKLTKNQYDTLIAQGLKANEHVELTAFAESCYDSNAYSEISDFKTAEADEHDLQYWEMSEQDWRDGQQAALEYAMYIYEVDNDLA